ncbi:MAG: mucoidy inhibitor MuiA family protein [Nonlabens sp.]
MRFLILLLCGMVATAQQNATSTIDEITVYLQGARITRTAKVKVSRGPNEIVINNLSADIDDSSIMLTDLAGMSLTGLNYKTSVLEKKAPTAQLEAINKRLDSVQDARVDIDAEIAGLNEEKTLLQNNRDLNKNSSGLTLAQVREFGNYYNSRIKAIAIELANLNKKRQKLQELENQLNTEKRNINPQMNELRGSITLKVNSDVSKTVNLEIVYNVNNAGWVPNYDITAAGANSDVELKFKGQVYQTSGTDWENVKLTLSTGDPFIDNTKPNLEAKRLKFVSRGYRGNAVGRSNKKYNPTVSRVSGRVTDSYGEPLIGVTVLQPQSSLRTTTNVEGKYSMNLRAGTEIFYSLVGYENVTEPIYSSVMNISLPESSDTLDEVVITGYAMDKKLRGRAQGLEIQESEAAPQIIAAVEENIASRTYELAQPYSIPSTGETTDIEISTNNLSATYEYYAAPVINENVFLTAKMKDWESLNLIPGEANVYFENAYTGKIYFDTDTTEESLVVSLGVDPQISVKREDVRDLKEKSFFGDKRLINKKYEIIVKNNRSKAIDLKLQDRIPLTANSEIKVDDEEPGDATMDKETQILTWNISLASGAQVKKTFSYEVKYPKDRRINLD